MALKFNPSVVRSSHLTNGKVIYLTPRRTWSRDINEALLVRSETEANRALTIANARQNIHVGAHLSSPDQG